MARRLKTEKGIIILLGAVQFMNILDFMMVMPLGPDFSISLGIPISQLGLIGGSYTISAAITGLICALFLDRFGRRVGLVFCLVGLFVGTIACALSYDFHSMLAARVLAGAFGGPATSFTLSIISDIVPPERRGRAMAALALSFSAASVLGLPFGLELARLWGWKAPFFVVAGMGFVIAFGVMMILPPLDSHLSIAKETGGLKQLFGILKRREVQWGLLAMTAGMWAGFMIIPNISAYLQLNAGFPREQLGLLYFSGGVASIFAFRIGGNWIDQYGAVKVAVLASVFLVATLILGFGFGRPLIPPVLLFILFMTSMSLRNITINTQASKIPQPQERARFQSLQSSVQHLAAGLGSMASTVILTQDSHHHLIGMGNLTIVSCIATVLIPVFMLKTEGRLKAAH
ncbi:MAG: MFS transporter [Oligoflexia bacterium]|nr:MFS transporter [Oligoflexia bacterium]